MSNFLLNFREVIIDEIKIHAIKLNTAYLFPYLVMKFCKSAHVPEIIALDQEIIAKKTHNPIKYNENQPILGLGKGVEIKINLVRTDGV